MSANADLIARIKMSYGCDQVTFDADILLLIRRFAHYVNALPATADSYFSGTGGLMRMSLEIAFHTLQATDSHILVGRATISERKNLEPRWRHAAFIAGLCSELHRTLSHLAVIDAHGEQWPAYLQPLTGWLDAQSSPRFHTRWAAPPPNARSLGLFALPMIVPSSMMTSLASGNSNVVPHMMSSISGCALYREHNVLDNMVRHCAAMVIDRDLKSSAARCGRPSRSHHLDRYFIDAFCRLIETNSAWTPNTEKSRVWFARDGLFVVWPNSVTEACRLLEADRIPGIPKEAEEVLDILIQSGVVTSYKDEEPTWLIYPPGTPLGIASVKIASPALLLSNRSPVQPLAIELARAFADGEPDQQPAKMARGCTEAEPDNEKSRPATRPEGESPEKNATQAQLFPQPAFALAPAMRLHPGVASALKAIVGTLNCPVPACVIIPAGLFVPLLEFGRRRVDTTMAIRSLFEAGMLVTNSSTERTCTHEFEGKPLPGVVISPKFVLGLASVPTPSSAKE